MITPSQVSRQRLGFTWGINSILSPYFESFDEALTEISRLLLDNTDAKSGDLVVVVAGTPFGVAGTTNTVRVLTLS
jgi:pyruvate kinase